MSTTTQDFTVPSVPSLDAIAWCARQLGWERRLHGLETRAETTVDAPPTPAPAVLDVRGVEKSYGRTEALRGVDLAVAPGTVLALLGPNGAGKTSLVSIVAGLRRPDAGTVHVAGIDVVRSPQ